MTNVQHELKVLFQTANWYDNIKDELIQDLDRWWKQYGKEKYKDRIDYWEVF